MPEGYIVIRDAAGTELSSDILAVHAALLRGGRVLYFSGSQHDELPATLAAARIYDPRTGEVLDVDSPDTEDLFCCGHVVLPNGDIFVAGGTATYPPNAPPYHQPLGGHHFVGIPNTFVYRRSTRTWQSRAPMAEGRWYPTCVSLPFGRVLAISGHGGPAAGHHENTKFEVFSLQTNSWSPPRDTSPPLEDHGTPMIYYPRLHLLPNGRLFCSSAWSSTDGTRTRLLDPESGELTVLSRIPDGRHSDHVYTGANFSSVLLPLEPPHYPARIFVCGGQYPRLFDMQAPGRGWEMAGGDAQGRRPYEKRAYANAVLLPDGSVLVVNGCRSEAGYPLSGGGKDSDAVLFAERYIPDAPYWPTEQRNTWQQLSSSTIPRVYHSVALLLPDGRVWIAGSNHDSARNRAGERIDRPGTDARELRMELYSPPYLDGAGPRPRLSRAPATIDYQSEFVIATPDAAKIHRATFLRAGSATHAFNFDQRYITLEIRRRDAGEIILVGPPDVNIAPEGVYLLFLVDGENIPSVGRFIQLVNPPPLPEATLVRAFVIHESQKGDLDTNVDLRSGDRLSIAARGEIWAGVWFTGNNGPNGWDNITSDPKFPYSGAPDSHPFALLGKIGGGSYFFVGTTLDRRPVETTGRLNLRINDDVPGNGKYAFEGTIAVHR